MKKKIIIGAIAISMTSQITFASQNSEAINQRKISMQIEIEEQEIILNKAEVELLSLYQQIELLESRQETSINIGKAATISIGLGIASLVLAIVQNTKASPGNHTAGYKALITGLSSIGIGSVVGLGNVLVIQLNREELTRLKQILPTIKDKIQTEKLNLQNMRTAIME